MFITLGHIRLGCTGVGSIMRKELHCYLKNKGKGFSARKELEGKVPLIIKTRIPYQKPVHELSC